MEALTGEDRGDAKIARRGATGVVVLGAGRSGTSAITRAFVTAGFFAGRDEDLLGAARSNPVGHYEPLPVLETNERLLERLGGGAPTREEQLALRAKVEPQLREILESLAMHAGGAPLAIKEPRINRLLPLWGPVMDGVLHPVLAVRDPLEVARSVARRDETPVGHALAAWEIQTTLALTWLAGREATVAHYGQLTNRTETAAEIVRAATAHLVPVQAKEIDPGRASSALRPDLRTHRIDAGSHATYLTQRQAELWQYLSELPSGNSLLSPPGELRAPSEAALEAATAEDRRVKLIGDCHALSTEYTKAIAQIGEFEKSLAEAHRAGRRAAEGEQRGLRELERVQHSPSWRITAPLRWLARILGRR